jgi:2,3-bisphosphoglycerate-dependent phosphoglycerate mutase
MEICFLRHGRSLADDEEKVEGRYDSPLTDRGRAQAADRARSWQSEGRSFDQIISSPLLRAKETAQIVGRHLGVPVQSDPLWMEIDNGPLAGLPRRTAQERFPLPEFVGPFDPLAGTGESRWTLTARAIQALASVISRDEGQCLVVSHGGILNAVIRTICGAQPQSNRSGLNFRFGDNGYLDARYNRSQDSWVILRFDPGYDS